MSNKLTTEEFISKAIRIHGHKYNYSLTKYTHSHEKVTIICNIHGEFKQASYSHLKGSGCTHCYIDAKYLSRDEFITKAINTHGDRYNYSQCVYTGTHNKTIIICEAHGSFKQTPHHHILGNGCPKCKQSKGENKIFTILTQLNIEFTQQQTFHGCKHIRVLKFDFYLPKYNTCIEFDGEQHFSPYRFKHKDMTHKFIQTQLHDNIKDSYCSNNNITLIRIPYTEFDNIKYILVEELKEFF